MPEPSQLARRVEDELHRAGLRTHSLEPPDDGGFGLQVVDDAEPPAPAVYVVWCSSGELLDEVYEHMINRKDVTHPLVLHVGHINHAMAQAMLEILLSAGLHARMSPDDLDPLTVEVFLE
jgi:hypothetical protein